ncbi:hypothetical protein [Ensifer aridi]|uniref:hypothetical protein n=1 Tax=Ensifer aridi TaxID=1708715 RepID=UPI000A119BDF|nr:hypothetical protein [Ensifer aridi]
MSAASNCRLIGRWRIVDADLWDLDYLQLAEPTAITIGPDGPREIAFAIQATLDIGSTRSVVSFTWSGFDKRDEVSGDVHTELLDDDAIEAYHNVDRGRV